MKDKIKKAYLVLTALTGLAMMIAELVIKILEILDKLQ